MSATAFAPGHVSGAFAVHDEAPDLLHKGSRGLGWSVDKGATARVKLADRTEIVVNGVPSPSAVTRRTLENLAPGTALSVRLELDLPVGQGFGMSAAGSLAAALAATHLLDLEPERALEATHKAEVGSGTGLGDAVGSWFGSGEIRVKPGCPPAGWAMRVEPPEGTEFLYCVLGQGIATPTIIRDAVWKSKTRELGDPAVDRVLAVGREKSWPAILEEAHRFTGALGLMPAPMLEVAEQLPTALSWGQSMLGNTLWVTGAAEPLLEAEEILGMAGRVIRCGVDPHGARMIR